MLNPARTMLERLAYLGWLGLTASSIGVLGVTPWQHWPYPGLFMLSGGLGGFILSRILNSVGRAWLHFAERAEEFDHAGANGFLPGTPEHEARANTLRQLFHQWEALDALRARGEADIWQVQAVRRQAESLLRADPQLRSEFMYEVSRRPELGER
jgi:hypothetical protein